uniref:Radial spoke head protein 9 homolog n=1 Tax=Megaselia scalaris TaxID=36166 RepID=T1GP96_MEGSC
MNIEYLWEGLELISNECDQRITPEQHILIESSLLILQNEHRFKDIFFWGRIDAYERDYFIAFGIYADCLGERKFYYSTDCYNWIMMPYQNKELFEPCFLCKEMLLGDPTHVTVVKLDPKFSFDENQIILATEPEIVKLKEEDRLSFLVHHITDETAIVPRGAIYKLIDKTCIHNPLFRGLGELEIDDQSFYFQYRMPKIDYITNLAKKPDYNYCIDFLDTIDETFPKKRAYSLTMGYNERVSIIRSLIWPGMTFFHKLNSRKHGFAYFGSAKYNIDLLFMM